MRATMTLVAACLACAGLMGCHHDSKQMGASGTKADAHVMASSDVCPFSGKPANPSYTSTYNGKTVGFCCPNCKAKFDAMSDADKAARLAAKH